ncbi:hypothetical protein [Companilactobacillus kimchiensis]|uniref:Uncharacterized protein n=1 Tax=Companilactobacillus kimchiensis TaxID=993692 RepID=A0A0R2LGC6_9LACO|nr:hypothetical protein [Companilactobacillus kimchiensis]KRO00894.1 hypothetical protein IV57_GL000216 [Companilactobacillus kimchiensis]
MEDKFTKDSLVKSDGFSVIDRDILQIVLSDSDQYSLTEAKRLIKKFKGGIK